MVDYKQPGTGKPVMRTVADYRQLNDALFHAGLNSGSQYEWEDTPNRLHFYVIDLHTDAQGRPAPTPSACARWTARARRSAAWRSPRPPTRALPAMSANCVFKVTNTGTAAPTDASLHPQDANAYLNNDIYRLSVSVEGQGWSAQLPNALCGGEVWRRSRPCRFM